MKLSIIICVYNTDFKHLSECLKSITESTLKDIYGEYEICMVDDGSTIDYSELLSIYPIKYKKTENQGIFAARTTGAKMASGEYAIYCDSDDTVSFNYYLPMVEKAVLENADIVINDWASHTVRSKYYCKNDDTIKKNINLFGDDVLLEFVRNEGRQHSYYVLWNKLYKTSLLLSTLDELAKAGFPPKTSYSEDAAINFFIWKNAKRLLNIHTGYYFYRIHPMQTVKVSSSEKLLSQINAMSASLSIMKSNIGKNRHKDEILVHLSEWSKLMARSHYSTAKSCNFSNLYSVIKEKYNVDKLEFSKLKDGKAYTKKALLGENFLEIERIFLSLWNSSVKQTVSYCGKDTYIKNNIAFLESRGKIVCTNKGADVKIPSFDIRLKSKLIHNTLVQKLGLIFFKKGSKAREFLKKFI
jgi:glycosyltransferase involved in cell wall biosynthesis